MRHFAYFLSYFLGSFVLAFGAFLYNPQIAVSPGPVLDAHNEASSDCRNCHAPFKADFTPRCIHCHTPSKIGLFKTTGEKITKPSKTDHQKLGNLSCVVCHTEHKGSSAELSLKPFSHKKLTSRESCKACHQSPQDKYHSVTSAGCNSCHTVESWKPATFNHASSAVSGGCNVCHKSPLDAFHKSVKTGCESCHTVKSWKGANFDHEKYFRFDKRHKSTCENCHKSGDYSTYTCYGCHAHSERGVRREHREEGISNYNNCVQCHRSGSEREAKRNWRKIRKSSSKSSRSRHDDDDDD